MCKLVNLKTLNTNLTGIRFNQNLLLILDNLEGQFRLKLDNLEGQFKLPNKRNFYFIENAPAVSRQRPI